MPPWTTLNGTSTGKDLLAQVVHEDLALSA